AREAIAYLATADDDLQLLQARRLANLLADLSEGAVLLDEAAWALDRDGDARKALVARRFARSHLETLPVRGIVDDARTVLDFFDRLIRYGTVAAAAVAQGLGRRALLEALDGAVEEAGLAVAGGLFLVVGPALRVLQVVERRGPLVGHRVLVVPLEPVAASAALHRARDPVEVGRGAQLQGRTEGGGDVAAEVADS